MDITNFVRYYENGGISCIFFSKYLEVIKKLPTFASAFENERCYKTVTKFFGATKERVL